jgi:hypothetical protein
MARVDEMGAVGTRGEKKQRGVHSRRRERVGECSVKRAKMGENGRQEKTEKGESSTFMRDREEMTAKARIERERMRVLERDG